MQAANSRSISSLASRSPSSYFSKVVNTTRAPWASGIFYLLFFLSRRPHRVLRQPLAAINNARPAGLQNHSVITPFDKQFAGRSYHLNFSLGLSVDHGR